MKTLNRGFDLETSHPKRYKLLPEKSLSGASFSDKKIFNGGIPKSDAFLSPKEVARYLNVSVKFIYERIARGDIEAQPMGRLRRIRQSTLENWLLCQKQRR